MLITTFQFSIQAYQVEEEYVLPREKKSPQIAPINLSKTIEELEKHLEITDDF